MDTRVRAKPPLRLDALSRRVHQIALSACCLIGLPALAGTAANYCDELGRLVETVVADGTSVIDAHDAVGNIKTVRHNAATTVGISGFSPVSGLVGTVVTVYGSSFSSTLASNIVNASGTSAAVTLATASSRVVKVPTGATTGFNSVNNGTAILGNKI